MKRFLALLALALVLMAGTAGMASAAILDFTSPPSTPPYDQISGLTRLNWDDTGYYGGHLWCDSAAYDSTISFANPTYVNNFQMNGMPIAGQDPTSYNFGPMVIEAFNAAGVKVWSSNSPVFFDEDHRDVGNYEAWLTVIVNTAAVSSIIFRAPNPLDSNYEEGYNLDGPTFHASIDNLVYTAAVPIPASALLLASGLLALVGLRRKFSR